MSQIIVVKDASNNKLRELESDASGSLKVVLPDVSALALEATLVAQSSKIVACNTGAVVVSSSALPSGASTEATLANQSAKIVACNTGAVVVSSSALPSGASTEASASASAGHLATVAGAVSGGVVQVSAGAPVSATNTHVFNATSISGGANAQSVAVDADTLKSVCIFGTTNRPSGAIDIQVSHDNLTYFELNNHYLPVDMITGDFGIQLDFSARYIRLSRANDSGGTEIINAHISGK